jgi:hypothetical protein
VLDIFTNILGLVGVTIILVTYFLLNTNKLSADNLNYQLLNFFGSWLILFSLIVNWNLASFVIEIFWILISMIGAYRILRDRKKE